MKTFALGPSQEGEVGPKGELVLKTPWAFTLTGEGIFTIVNGEQNGYIHAIIGVGAARSGIRVANIDPTESGKIYLHSSERLRFSVPVKTEVVDPDGRKKKVKFEKVLRAGPGEQIAMVFTFPNHENQSATMMIAVEYYSDEGQLVGQTDAKQFSFSEDARTSQSWTFMKSDLVTH